jgi:hypothetical protein
MALVLNLGDRKRLRAAGTNSAGVRAPLPGRVVWSVEPPGVVTLAASDTLCGLSADGPGECIVTAICNGLTATFPVSVIAPAATRLVINAEDQS